MLSLCGFHPLYEKKHFFFLSGCVFKFCLGWFSNAMGLTVILCHFSSCNHLLLWPFSSQDGRSMNFVSEYWRTVRVCMKGVQLCPEATQSQLCLRSAEFVYFWSAEFVYFWSAGFVCIVFCCLTPDKQVFFFFMSAVWSMAIPYLLFSSSDQNVSVQCASSAGFEPSVLCFKEEIFVVIVGRWRTTTEKRSLLHGFTWNIRVELFVVISCLVNIKMVHWLCQCVVEVICRCSI